MYQDLKQEMKEIIEIVRQCPEKLQEKCFELLLENYLSVLAPRDSNNSKSNLAKSLAEDVELPTAQTGDSLPEADKTVTSEIKLTDFHVKVQKFLNDNSISMEVINALYYKEEGKLMPFYETLKSTSMATCQIRLALLTSFENCFADTSGEFSFNCETVRERCKTMKCYDAKNFSSNFKKNAIYWDNLPEKYDGTFKIAVSLEGRKELAKIISDLSEGA